MMKYKEYKQIDFADIARQIRQYWEENRLFERSVEEKEGQPTFTFYEGPPSANGSPGIHHMMARTVKDIFCRYKTMKGYQVKRKGGWDTHGLPVELQVEKELGITKEDIGSKISIEDYNRRCQEAVMKYKNDWDELTRQMGYWLDLQNPYITFDKKYMESVWYLLKQFHEQDLLYKGYTIQPYSPAAGSALSSHELNQPGCYKPVKDVSITAQFKVPEQDHAFYKKVKSNLHGDLHLLAWTTTPWTLPANSAIGVGKKLNYVAVKTFNEYTYEPITVILAQEKVDAFFNPKAKDLKLEDYQSGDKKIPFEVIDEFTGEELVGLHYEQLLPYVPIEHPGLTVTDADFVTTEEGTGLVHLSKTFGADDFRVCSQKGIPGVTVKDENGHDVPIVNKKGRFVNEITDFADMPVKNYDDRDESDPDYKPTDVLIVIKLKEENKAFHTEKYEHNYPHCWRTDKPIIYYPLDSWFIRTTQMKDRLVELNKTINWQPASTGEGRFGNWLENLVDWNLSRSRFWGTPLPVWRTEDQQEEICIGSLDDLKKEIDKSIEAGFMEENIGDDFDLHRPHVDNVVLVSPSGKKMYRETDLIDVWFDSGAMPYAQWHFPFENRDTFLANYPADFICEGVDQTRGWFFTLHTISGMLNDQVAFKNVVSTGLVLDKHGDKMSKRKGNVIDPFETLQNYGPDATRWYMIGNANPWDNLKFDLAGVQEIQRKFFSTLQNTYSFFALYANLDDFSFSNPPIALADRKESDRWIISRLNSLIGQVDDDYREYEPTRAVRKIQDFLTDDLSNWYVRLNRKRFWQGEYNKDKEAAYQTLYTCLITIAKLSAPVAPFYSDQLFLDLNRVSGQETLDSVHLSDFPRPDVDAIDHGLEEKMGIAQTASSLVHSLRKKHTIKVRQPLSRILVPALDEHFKSQIQSVEDLIKNETNIKNVEYIEDTSGVITKKIKPNFKKLGQQYGKKMKEIAAAVGEMTQQNIEQLEKEQKFALNISDQQIELTPDDVEISSEDIPGWSVATEENLTVALDINISEDLKKEGVARDLINRIQNVRKEMGLEVQDKIKLAFTTDDPLLKDAIEQFQNYICNETQALDVKWPEQADADAYIIDMDEHSLKLKIELSS